MDKQILDVCCGAKMFYFDKNDPRVLYPRYKRNRNNIV